MGMLDDAIREHLELKRRGGAAGDEVDRLENEALGPARREAPAPVIAEPTDQPDASELPPPPAPEPEAAPASWLDDDEPLEPELPAASSQSTSEFTASEASEAGIAPEDDYVAPDEEGDDLLEETPDFLQETPEHDRLWFEQKPPRDFDV